MTEIIIAKEGAAGRITLNRPEALNSLTEGMLRAIDRALDEWEGDDQVALVIIEAAGQALRRAETSSTCTTRAGRVISPLARRSGPGTS